VVQTLPAVRTCVVVGEYQFDRAEEFAEHIFDAEGSTPSGTPAAGWQTVAGEVRPATIASDGDILVGVVFSVRVTFEAQELGKHTIALTLDGNRIAELPYDIVRALGGPAPDDASSLSEK
jgi:hypothetical protein